MKIPNKYIEAKVTDISLARIVSEDSQLDVKGVFFLGKSSKDS